MRNCFSKTFVWLLLLFSLVNYGQKDDGFFYYYKNEKLFLDLDLSTLCVSIEGQESLSAFLTAFERTSSDKILSNVEMQTRRSVVCSDPGCKERQSLKSYQAMVEVNTEMTPQAYLEKIKTYNEMAGVAMAGPCFKTATQSKIGLSKNFYVKLKDQADMPELYEQAQKYNIEVMGRNQYMPLWFTLSCTKNTNINSMQAANFFYETGLFDATEPELTNIAQAASADPFFGNQWHLKNTGQPTHLGLPVPPYGTVDCDIKAPQAWAITTGNPNIKAAIFDGGIEVGHPDLAANFVGVGFDAFNNSSPATIQGDGNHGTAVAGLFGALQNNFGVSGVAPTAGMVSISAPIGGPSSSPGVFANGFGWALQNGIDIISCSWGIAAGSNILDNAITNALTYGRNGLGMVVVFSMGNNNINGGSYPANSNPLIISVGAIDRCGHRSQQNINSCDQDDPIWVFPGSNYGAPLDVVAGGSWITTTDRTGAGGYNDGTGAGLSDPNYCDNFCGTSAACPQVAGVAALVLSVNPGLYNWQVNDVIELSAQKSYYSQASYNTVPNRPNGTWYQEFGYGLVNAFGAVEMVLDCSYFGNTVVSGNVYSPDIDQKESLTIEANNTIDNGAGAQYHAKNEIKLSDGFAAIAGSEDHIYIDLNCTNTFYRNSSPLNHPTDETSGSIENTSVKVKIISEKKENEQIQNRMSAFPNPNNGLFKVEFKHAVTGKISVTNEIGLLILSKELENTSKTEIELQGVKPGIYFLNVSSPVETLKPLKLIVD